MKLIPYVGSKSKLIPEIEKHMKDCDVIFEPFGGSAAFSLSQNLPFYYTDAQPELVNFLSIVKEQPEKLVERILELHGVNVTSEAWYALRAKDREDSFLDSCPISRAARYYYLLNTSHNNLYRVNQKGQANMPWAKGKKKLPIDFKERILEASEKFQSHCKGISCSEFDNLEVLTSVIDSGYTPFVLIDGPYYGTFDQYVKDRPDEEFWKRMKDFADDLNKAGVKFLLTNSYDPFILELFKEYKIEEVPIRYTVAPSGEKRVTSSEAFITN